MPDAGEALSIDELAERTGVPVRTVRYYVSEGLLPGPIGRGRQAEYTAAHLARLRLIRQLVEQRMPLAEQRARLSTLSDADVQALLADHEREAHELRVAEAAPSAREYVAKLLRRAGTAHSALPSSTPVPASLAEGSVPSLAAPIDLPEVKGAVYHRVELAPGVELHVQADAADREKRLIDRIVALARGRRRSGGK